MGNLKLNLTLLSARLIFTLIKLAHAGEGTSFIGSLILKYNPEFIRATSRYIQKEKIAVTGTNGKTTTCGIISHVLKANNRNIIANSKGANMLTGIANAFALSFDPRKVFSHCVIESDEAYLEKIQHAIHADYILVTNLFRDQLDRYGELDITKQKIQNGINANPNVRPILNADDPLVASLTSLKTPIFYGIKSVIDNTNSLNVSAPDEIYTCSCGKKLEYTKKFYAQQGHYKCPCGFARPKPRFEADIILEKNYSIIKLGEEEYKLPLVGLFNAYNALGAIALLKTIGVNDINNHLATFKTAFGRSEARTIYGHPSIIQLIKNPAGANQVIQSVDLNSNILIIINDNYADGRDISWLWDANFERFAQAEKEITVSGIRAYDMATRLKYAGVSKEKIKVINEIPKAIDYITKIADNNITILPSYTALLELNKLWKKL